jgi:hypothetical protein
VLPDISFSRSAVTALMLNSEAPLANNLSSQAEVVSFSFRAQAIVESESTKSKVHYYLQNSLAPSKLLFLNKVSETDSDSSNNSC